MKHYYIPKKLTASWFIHKFKEFHEEHKCDNFEVKVTIETDAKDGVQLMTLEKIG